MLPFSGLKRRDSILDRTESIPSWSVPRISTIPSSVSGSSLITTGCTIVINEDPETEEGIVEILGTDQEGIYSVLSKIESLLFKPEKGNTYKVKVIKMLDFGAVVEYLDAPGNEVLLHVSEIAWERTNNVSDVIKLGDELEVKYFGVDPRTRKEKVSRKALLEKPEGFVERPPRPQNRDNRGRDNRGRDNRNKK